MVNHPLLQWVATNKTHMLTLPNTVKVKGGDHLMFFGRYAVGNTTYPAKVHTGDTHWGMKFDCFKRILYFFGIILGCYYNDRGEKYLDDGFEVLTCGGLMTTTTQATTTTI